MWRANRMGDAKVRIGPLAPCDEVAHRAHIPNAVLRLTDDRAKLLFGSIVCPPCIDLAKKQHESKGRARLRSSRIRLHHCWRGLGGMRTRQPADGRWQIFGAVAPVGTAG